MVQPLKPLWFLTAFLIAGTALPASAWCGFKHKNLRIDGIVYDAQNASESFAIIQGRFAKAGSVYQGYILRKLGQDWAEFFHPETREVVTVNMWGRNEVRIEPLPEPEPAPEPAFTPAPEPELRPEIPAGKAAAEPARKSLADVDPHLSVYVTHINRNIHRLIRQIDQTRIHGEAPSSQAASGVPEAEQKTVAPEAAPAAPKPAVKPEAEMIPAPAKVEVKAQPQPAPKPVIRPESLSRETREAAALQPVIKSAVLAKEKSAAAELRAVKAPQAAVEKTRPAAGPKAEVKAPEKPAVLEPARRTTVLERIEILQDQKTIYEVWKEGFARKIKEIRTRLTRPPGPARTEETMTAAGPALEKAAAPGAAAPPAGTETPAQGSKPEVKKPEPAPATAEIKAAGPAVVKNVTVPAAIEIEADPQEKTSADATAERKAAELLAKILEANDNYRKENGKDALSVLVLDDYGQFTWDDLLNAATDYRVIIRPDEDRVMVKAFPQRRTEVRRALYIDSKDRILRAELTDTPSPGSPAYDAAAAPPAQVSR